MFNILLSLSPTIYMLYWFFKIRKKSESINCDINSGYKCYGCKKDLDSFEDRVSRIVQGGLSVSDLEKLDKPIRCKSCERDIKLNHLTKKFGFRYKLMANIDKFLISGKYERFIWISLSIIMSYLILDMFFLREWRVFFYLGQLCQLIYWMLFIRRYKLTTIKNPISN